MDIDSGCTCTFDATCPAHDLPHTSYLKDIGQLPSDISFRLQKFFESTLDVRSKTTKIAKNYNCLHDHTAVPIADIISLKKRKLNK